MNNRDIERKFDILIDAIKEVAKPIPAIPAIPQIQPIPAIPAIANSPDHDLLTKLDEKVRLGFIGVSDSIKELKDGTANKIDDHERRMREVEIFKNTVEGKASQNSVYLALAVAVILPIVTLLIGHFWK